MLDDEVAALEKRVHRLIAAYRQVLLERKRAIQERDRLVEINNDLRRRIEGVVERIRALETDDPQ